MGCVYRFPVQSRWAHSYAPGTLEIVQHHFVANVGDDTVRLSREHLEHAWLPFEEAVARLRYENNRLAFEEGRRQLDRWQKQGLTNA